MSIQNIAIVKIPCRLFESYGLLVGQVVFTYKVINVAILSVLLSSYKAMFV